MTIFRSLIIAISIYSKIPVPQFEWKEEDMKYTLCFFPWIGAIIGGALYVWLRVCSHFNVGGVCYVMIGTALPLLITGGFHVDGYMDTMDCFHSYQPKERKLEILKDSHIGAFSVIMLLLYYLIYIGAFSQINGKYEFGVFCCGFYLSRILSGMSVISFPTAKENGMLNTFADTASKRIVKGSLYLQLFICIFIMANFSLKTTIIALVGALGCFMYYRYKCIKELGGITGDTAGYFVTVCECTIAIAAAIGGFI